MTKILPTSFSAIKSFDTCPRKHHAEKVLKLFPFEKTDQIIYGEYVHEAAEKYIRDGDPLPKDLKKLKPMLDRLVNIPGDKYCEHKMGVTRALRPTGFFDNKALYRGIADLLIVNGDRAWVVDYKTGSAKYPEKKQLELMAIMVMAHFPEVVDVRGALLFTAAKVLVRAKYDRDNLDKLWKRWCTDADMLVLAAENENWPAKQNGLCRDWCPVTTCEHNGGGSKCKVTQSTMK